MKRLDTLHDTARPASAPVADAERRFAQRVCRALDASAAALPQPTLDRLALARKAALRAQPAAHARLAPAQRFVTAGGPGSSRFGFARAGLVASAVMLVGVCVAGLYQFEQDRRIEELADMDTAVLNDDLPISAYTDQGFNAFLKQNP